MWALMSSCNSVQAAVPAQTLLATGVDQYRKPEKGMWDYFVEHGNDGKQPGAASAVLLLNMFCRPLLCSWASKLFVNLKDPDAKNALSTLLHTGRGPAK